MKKRVLITGIGVLSPIGVGKEDYIHSLKTGRSGTGPITLFDASSFPTRIAAEVKDFNPHRMMKGMKVLDLTDDRRVLFANYANVLALEDAKLSKKILSHNCALLFYNGSQHLFNRGDALGRFNKAVLHHGHHSLFPGLFLNFVGSDSFDYQFLD